METKKISFGFSKITQKNNFVQPQPKEENKVELIKCFEGKEMKLVEEPKPKELLVIPMKEIGKTSAALASLMKRRAVLNDEDEPEKATESKESNGIVVQEESNQTENLEEKAARELLAEAKSQKDVIVDSKLVLPVLKPDELPLDGAKEPTFDDYESIPVEQFGRAMLRGMGWIDPPAEKDNKKLPEGPVPRPKGMGLGADKAIKSKPLLVQPEKNEVLEIKRKAFVRILAGKHKELYGQIEDFDDFAGRIIVRMAIGGAMEVFNEFMCQPVAKKEFEQYGKCINAAKFEAYKKLENEYGQIMIKKDDRDNIEIRKSDLGRDFKEAKVKEEKRDPYDEEKFDKKSYERSKDRERDVRRYKDDNSLKKSDSRSHSPSNKPSTSSQNNKNEFNSTSRENTDSRREAAHTSRSRQKRKADSDSDSSDSDSADSDDSTEYRRRHKKKSSKHSSKKKSKKSKSRRREFSSASEEDSSDAEKRYKSHKKKTKKSKRQRSRSRSRGRR